MNPAPEALKQSIQALGIVHPVGLVAGAERYRIISGHRRLQIAEELGIDEISAFVMEVDDSAESMLAANLNENLAHRCYGDMEKGVILDRLIRAGVPESRILQEYMPLIGLERSKKLLREFLQASQLSPGFKKLLHDLNVSLRVANVICGWDPASRQAAEDLFSTLRPGVNKWRDMVELIDETAIRENVSPVEIIDWDPIQSVLEHPHFAPAQKYDQVFQSLHPRRFPLLSRLNRKVAAAVDKLELHPETRLRTSKTFESDEIKIELKFRTKRELSDQLERLNESMKSEAMNELIDAFKNLE